MILVPYEDEFTRYTYEDQDEALTLQCEIFPRRTIRSSHILNNSRCDTGLLLYRIEKRQLQDTMDISYSEYDPLPTAARTYTSIDTLDNCINTTLPRPHPMHPPLHSTCATLQPGPQRPAPHSLARLGSLVRLEHLWYIST